MKEEKKNRLCFDKKWGYTKRKEEKKAVKMAQARQIGNPLNEVWQDRKVPFKKNIHLLLLRRLLRQYL